MKTISFNKRSGFTLIEIIIVVVILGILAAVALPRLSENINKSKSAEAFQMGSAIGRAFDRCLSQESGGNLPVAGDVANCNTFAKVNMATPPATNFVYTLSNAGTDLYFTAGLVGGGATDWVNFTFFGATGALTRACGPGIFSKMCK